MRPATVLTVALLVTPRALLAQVESQNCRFAVDSVGQTGRVMETPTGTNYFAGGGVWISCLDTKVHMKSDSVASYGGTIGIVQFLGNVKYEDSTITMTATNGTYFKQGERWEARGDVVMQNLESGSTLTGPSLDYYRALKGTRDTLEMYAVGRPRINFIPQDSTGKAEEPYVINADRVRMKGNDRMWGAGRVTIDRSDFAATSDSMRLDTGAGSDGTLLGSPVLRGLGADSFNLRGQRIDLKLDQRKLTWLVAKGDAKAISTDIDLVGDTIYMDVEQDKLVQTQAWGDSIRPFAHSTDYAIRADSLVFDTPGQHLRESRAFGDAWVGGTVDSSAAGEDCFRNYRVCDWLSGDTIVAQFAQMDSAGKSRTVLHQVDAKQHARAHYRTDNAKGAERGINYSRAEQITVTMKGKDDNGVDRVHLRLHVDGVQLDPLKQPVPADSTAAPPVTPPRGSR
jgi:hypothetical protein